MMEAARTSETSLNFYQTKRRNHPEDSHLHTRRRENLKSHKIGDMIFPTPFLSTATIQLLFFPVFQFLYLL
jgi:hypothetical protein